MLVDISDILKALITSKYVHFKSFLSINSTGRNKSDIVPERKSIVFRLFTEKSTLWFIWFSRFLYCGFHLHVEFPIITITRVLYLFLVRLLSPLLFLLSRHFKPWPCLNNIPSLSIHCQCKKTGAIWRLLIVHFFLNVTVTLFVLILQSYLFSSISGGNVPFPAPY